MIGPKPQSPESDPNEKEPDERLQRWDNPIIGDRLGPLQPTVVVEPPAKKTTSQPAVEHETKNEDHS